MTDKIRVGINGFGRIGRTILRAAMKREDIEIVAINDLLQVDHLAYLLKYDSVHGGFQGHLSSTVSSLDVNGEAIRVFSEAEPKSIGWGEVGVDLVIESTGLFLSGDLAHGHLTGGAGKVLLSAPPKDDTPVFVMGVYLLGLFLLWMLAAVLIYNWTLGPGAPASGPAVGVFV